MGCGIPGWGEENSMNQSFGMGDENHGGPPLVHLLTCLLYYQKFLSINVLFGFRSLCENTDTCF